MWCPRLHCGVHRRCGARRHCGEHTLWCTRLFWCTGGVVYTGVVAHAGTQGGKINEPMGLQSEALHVSNTPQRVSREKKSTNRWGCQFNLYTCRTPLSDLTFVSSRGLRAQEGEQINESIGLPIKLLCIPNTLSDSIFGSSRGIPGPRGRKHQRTDRVANLIVVHFEHPSQIRFLAPPEASGPKRENKSTNR